MAKKTSKKEGIFGLMDSLEKRVNDISNKLPKKKIYDVSKYRGDSGINGLLTRLNLLYEVADHTKYWITTEIARILKESEILKGNISKPAHYQEILAVCPREHTGRNPNTIAHGLFSSKKLIEKAYWKPSKLAYVKDRATLDKTEIENGRILCSECNKKYDRKTLNQKCGDVYFFREVYDINYANHQIMQELAKMGSDVVALIIERYEGLGFDSIVDVLEKSQLSRVSYFGFKPKIQRVLRELRETYIPKLQMISSTRTKLSILNKYLRIKNLDDKSSFDDFIGLRIIFPEKQRCYHAARVLDASNLLTTKQWEDYIKNPKPSDYQSIHIPVTINPDKLQKELSKYFGYDELSRQGLVSTLNFELQIRTNKMDNDAILDPKQNHGSYKLKEDIWINKQLRNKKRVTADIMRILIEPTYLAQAYKC